MCLEIKGNLIVSNCFVFGCLIVNISVTYTVNAADYAAVRFTYKAD